MFVKLYVASLCCFFAVTGGCDSNRGNNLSAAPTNTPSAAASNSANPTNVASEAKPDAHADNKVAVIPTLDACGLIEKSEIESLQGAKLLRIIPSKRDAAPLAISQCYYSVFSTDGTKDLSVHLEVTENDQKSANQHTVGDLWREKFLGAKGTKKMEKPKLVSDLGDGAYWAGNNKSGALYVLKNDSLVRISIGGTDDEAMKIQKTKTLAEKVLRRLP